ncbi:hypothetical protein QFZ98_006596 [Paraburkholderia youngii]
MGFPGMPCLGRHAYAWRLHGLQTGSRPVASLCMCESFRANNATPGLCFVKKEGQILIHMRSGLSIRAMLPREGQHA